MNGQRGDDLDDDFVPDELVATSGEEDAVDRPGDDIGGLLSADEDAEEMEVHLKERSVTEKKRKRREKEKERRIKVCVTRSLGRGPFTTSIILFAEEEIGRNSGGYRASFSGSATCSQSSRLHVVYASQSLPCNVRDRTRRRLDTR